ncbi:coagulation factor VII-like [Mytilus galloprovincialis]|uniref:coagulation factor VII-like n=1 Tax=Mytilus galloprovincialis TaxID=29158 RepID=UPI003F7BC640
MKQQTAEQILLHSDKNECLAAPCQNGGNCTDKWADFACDCFKRFNGTKCEKDCRPGHADITFIVDTSSSQENSINRTVEFIS